MIHGYVVMTDPPHRRDFYLIDILLSTLSITEMSMVSEKID